MTDEKRTSPLNQFQRPRYRVGDTLRVTTDGGMYAGWRCEVEGVRVFQAFGYTRVRYLYHVRFDSRMVVDFPEDTLKPESEA